MLRLSLLLAIAAAVALAANAQMDDKEYEQFHVVYEWYKMDYTWPDDRSKARALSSQQFLPENNAISGIKVYQNRLYLTVPRWKEGVPATLASIPMHSPDNNASPKLQPFPSWAMQEVGNCSALQFVQNVEVDSEGRMWVLDTGRVNILGRVETKCPPKLVIIDLNGQTNTKYSVYGEPTTNFPTTYGGNGFNSRGNSFNIGSNYEDNNAAKVIRTFQFPDTVVSGLGGYLVDLVLDPADGWHAYISDGGDADPGIVVYSFRENRAWKVRDNRSMKADPAVREFSVDGKPVDILQNVSPLAFDVKKQLVYYSPLTSLRMFSIPATSLRDQTRARDAGKDVVDVGAKLGLSQGFAMDNRGVVYYGLIDANGVAKWNTSIPFAQGQHVISKDALRLQYPTNFGFDDVGYLWLVSNRMHNYIGGEVDLNEPNYRVIRGLTGTKSYLYTEGIGDMTTAMSTASTNSVEDNTSRFSSRTHKNGTHKNGGSWASGAPVALLGTLALVKMLA